jgi:hypothetical protein
MDMIDQATTPAQLARTNLISFWGAFEATILTGRAIGSGKCLRRRESY